MYEQDIFDLRMRQAELETELEISKQRLNALEEKQSEPVDVEQVGGDRHLNATSAQSLYMFIGMPFI